jgi:hypothetical protein
LSSLKEKIAKRLVARYKPNAQDKEFKSFADARTIGLIYDTEVVKSKQITKMVHYFESMGKNVTTIGFVNEKEIRNYLPNYKEEYFCLVDLTFWKLPKEEKIKRFISTDFDYLINLDTVGQLQLQAISAQSVAKVRVGKHMDEFAYAHDFMIQSDASNAEELFEEIKNYIK